MDQIQKLLTKLYRGVGSSRAKRLERLLANGEWSRIQKETVCEPSIYQNSQAYFRDALVVDITRKLLLPGDNDARAKAAVDTFFQCERENATTNARMAILRKMYYEERLIDAPNDIPILDLIRRWRREIRRVLGPTPWKLEPGFSGGATLSDTGQLTTIPDKISTLNPTLYAGFPYLHMLPKTPWRRRSALKYVRANRFFTVPKDSQKDRGCCVEASLNIAYQLGVGRYLKQRYKKAYKVDMSTSPELHHELAQLGSWDGSLATIDLSNASDTIARELVRLVLPTSWWKLLNSLRAHCTEINGKIYHLAKFSSMGNGFTFELETILFRSLITALNIKEGWVFGDDIIVPTENSSDMVAALRYFGFTPNKKKTFCEGPFRESCGGDFFNGQLVRAYFMKRLPDHPAAWIAVANGLRRADPELTYTRHAWRFAVDQVPIPFRNFGPEGLGDSVIWDPDAVAKCRRKFTEKAAGVVVREYLADSFRGLVRVNKSYDLGKYWTPYIAMVAGSLGAGPEIVPRAPTDTDPFEKGFYRVADIPWYEFRGGSLDECLRKDL